MKTPGYRVLLALCVAAPVLPAAAETQSLLESGGFEWPAVLAPRSLSEGADISKSAMNAEWVRFKDKPDADGGQLVLGLTNEIARSGRQCLYVEFNKLTKPKVSAELGSDFIPVKAGKSYRVAIWGRIDKKRPITLAQRLPFLKLRVDWFKVDEEGDMAQVGDVVWKVQPIPGPLKRPPLFIAGDWRQFFADMTAPVDATFIKMTWSWETPIQEGETNGVIFFDDASLEGEPGPKPPEEELEEYDEKPVTDAPAAPADKPEQPKTNTPAPAPAPEKPATSPARKEPKIDLTPVR
jgi:hypothetical protein